MNQPTAPSPKPKAENHFSTPKIEVREEKLKQMPVPTTAQKPAAEQPTQAKTPVALAFNEENLKKVWQAYLYTLSEGSMVKNFFKNAQLQIEQNKVRILVTNSFAQQNGNPFLQEIGIFIRRNFPQQKLEVDIGLLPTQEIPKFDKLSAIAEKYPILESFKKIFDLE